MLASLCGLGAGTGLIGRELPLTLANAHFSRTSSNTLREWPTSPQTFCRGAFNLPPRLSAAWPGRHLQDSQHPWRRTLLPAMRATTAPSTLRRCRHLRQEEVVGATRHKHCRPQYKWLLCKCWVSTIDCFVFSHDLFFNVPLDFVPAVFFIAGADALVVLFAGRCVLGGQAHLSRCPRAFRTTPIQTTKTIN